MTYGSRSVQGQFKVSVQGEPLDFTGKFKVVQGSFNLFYKVFFNHSHQDDENFYLKYKYISIRNHLEPLEPLNRWHKKKEPQTDATVRGSCHSPKGKWD